MPTEMQKRGWTAAIFFVVAVWLGLLVGVSFLATMAKFLAPGLTLPVALDVGRHTFAVFNKAECALAVLLLFVVFAGARTRLCVFAALVVSLAVLAETAWLLPVLDQRVDMIIAGRQPPQASYHQIFILLQYAKLTALAVLAFVMARRLVRSPSHA